MRRRHIATCLLGGVMLAGCGAGGNSQAAVRPWPLKHLEIGLMDGEGGAAKLAAKMPVKLRYQYLSGGVNTSNPWPTWGRGDGQFVDDYVADSRAAGLVPVFTYYELRQSSPGASNADESSADRSNLTNVATMKAYFENVQLMFERLGDAGGPAVVHVEPDLWGYIQQHGGDDASKTPAAVASTGIDALKGLPNTAAGVAQAFVRLRNASAPQVSLGYALSIWGTNKDIVVSDESDPAIDALSQRSVNFYRSLHAPFDDVFAEFSDRTTGYAIAHGASPDVAWTASDFARHARFLANVHAGLRRPLVLWQIPLGNAVSRSENNTTYHYQDNRVQWLLSAAGKFAHLRTYRDAGAVALLFGPGQGDDTHADDTAGDGITNPPAINGNTRVATSADDDGGYFAGRVRAYATAGSLTLRR